MEWNDFFERRDVKKELKSINKELKKQKKEGITILPIKENRFNCFERTKFQDVKVVIIMQDPYKNIINDIPQAHGLCASVPDGVPIPPTLNNMLKELKDDLGYDIPESGNLEKWADQGVLLLNRTLTLKQGESNSHKTLWTDFSAKLMKFIVENKDFVVFICWGGDAQASLNGLNMKEHIVISGTHPSPLGANKGGFFGKKYYSCVNNVLKDNNIEEIDWNLNK